VIYREKHILPEETAEATFDCTCQKHMELLATVTLLIDDPDMRKLPCSAAEELFGGRDEVLRTGHP
jgi:hypothetical protein